MSKIMDLLEQNNIKVREFDFEGHCVGTSEALPMVVGYYSTVRYGRLEEYLKGAPWAGDWVMVWEYYMPGAPEYPSHYRAVYVRTKDLDKAQQILLDNGYEIVNVDLPSERERKSKMRREILSFVEQADDINVLHKISEVIHSYMSA